MTMQARKNIPAQAPINGLAFVGALIYFLQHPTSFSMEVFGVLKAMVWPAVLVYELLEFLKL